MTRDPASMPDAAPDRGNKRSKRRRYTAVFVTLVVLATTLGTVIHFLPDLQNAVFSDDELAPDFTIETQDGPWTLSEHRGEVVVLDLMAVDCASCRITEKAMVRLDQQRPNATIVSIDIWTTLEDFEYLQGHMQDLNATWPYGMDTDDVLFKYGAYEISKVVVIDPEGRITWSAVGGITYKPLVQAVDEAGAGGAASKRNLQLSLFAFAAVAGVASFFAPCCFPLLPGYMAYTLSLGSPETRPRVRDAVIPGLAAASGVLLVYAVFGLIVAALGESASPWLPLLQPLVGLLAILLGIALLAGLSMERLIAPLQHGIDRIRRRITGSETEGTLSGYFGYGLGYGAAAAGCTAPIFLQLTLISLAVGPGTGLRIFAVYAGVAALLMVLVTLLAVVARTWIQRRAGRIVQVVTRASGVVMIAAGIYLVWFYTRGFGVPWQ